MPIRPSLRAVAAMLALSLAFVSVMARAADPQPYTVKIDDTGDGNLNDALSATSLLVTLRTKALSHVRQAAE